LTRMRTASGSSDLSDEVFLSCNSEINTIFDHDGASTSPVPPQRRKKKPAGPESSPEKLKEIRKQIEDLTLKVKEDEEVEEKSPKIEQNGAVKKEVINNNTTSVNKENVSSKKTSSDSVTSVTEIPKAQTQLEPAKLKAESQIVKKPPINLTVFDSKTAGSIQRSSSLRNPEFEKKDRTAITKCNSLRKDHVVIQSDDSPKVPLQQETEKSGFKRTNSLKKAKEYEEKIQKSSTFTKPPRPETVAFVPKTNSLNRVKAFEQIVQKTEKIEPLKKPPPEPKEPPPPAADLKSESTQSHDPVFAQNFSVQVVERKTFYPEITKDNIVVLPTVPQEMKEIIADEAIAAEEDASLLETSLVDSLLDGSSLGTSMSEEQMSAEESFRSRKGSNSSDIVAWKSELLQLWGPSDEEDEVYHTAKNEVFLVKKYTSILNLTNFFALN